MGEQLTDLEIEFLKGLEGVISELDIFCQKTGEMKCTVLFYLLKLELLNSKDIDTFNTIDWLLESKPDPYAATTQGTESVIYRSRNTFPSEFCGFEQADVPAVTTAPATNKQSSSEQQGTSHVTDDSTEVMDSITDDQQAIGIKSIDTSDTNLEIKHEPGECGGDTDLILESIDPALEDELTDAVFHVQNAGAQHTQVSLESILQSDETPLYSVATTASTSSHHLNETTISQPTSIDPGISTVSIIQQGEEGGNTTQDAGGVVVEAIVGIETRGVNIDNIQATGQAPLISILPQRQIIVKDKSIVNPYECPVCPKTFALRYQLKRHLTCHSTERNFRCDLCEKGFKDASNLQTHMKLKHEEKRFVCSYCNKPFPTEPRLQSHVTCKHSGIMKYRCKLCQRPFSTMSNFNKHKKVHKTRSSTNCEVCGWTFAGSGMVYLHQKKQHKEFWQSKAKEREEKNKDKKTDITDEEEMMEEEEDNASPPKQITEEETPPISITRVLPKRQSRGKNRKIHGGDYITTGKDKHLEELKVKLEVGSDNESEAAGAITDTSTDKRSWESSIAAIGSPTSSANYMCGLKTTFQEESQPNANQLQASERKLTNNEYAKHSEGYSPMSIVSSLDYEPLYEVKSLSFIPNESIHSPEWKRRSLTSNSAIKTEVETSPITSSPLIKKMPWKMGKIKYKKSKVSSATSFGETINKTLASHGMDFVQTQDDGNKYGSYHPHDITRKEHVGNRNDDLMPINIINEPSVKFEPPDDEKYQMALDFSSASPSKINKNSSETKSEILEQSYMALGFDSLSGSLSPSNNQINMDYDFSSPSPSKQSAKGKKRKSSSKSKAVSYKSPADACIEPTQLKCHICLEVFETASQSKEFIQHILEHNAENKDEIVSRKYDPELVFLVTDTSQPEQFLESYVLNCPVCDEIFTGMQVKSFRKHMSEIHEISDPSQVSFKCNICDKSYAEDRYVRRHYAFHFSPRMFCSICGGGYIGNDTFRYHKKLHVEGSKIHQCSTCGKTFVSEKYLRSHEAIHSGEKPIPCPNCCVSFPCKFILNNHLRKCTAEKPSLVCIRCTNPRTFYCKDNYDAHQSWHNSVDHYGVDVKETYNCPTCGKILNSLKSVRKHMMDHRGEKPHKCVYCGRGFSRTDSLKTHYKACSADKPCLVCTLCNNSTFKTKEGLQDHMKTRHFDSDFLQFHTSPLEEVDF